MNCLTLRLRKVAEIVLNGLQIRNVSEQLTRVHKIFVHIIEVSQQDIAPTDEIVKRFRPGVERFVAVVKPHQLNHPAARAHRSE